MSDFVFKCDIITNTWYLSIFASHRISGAKNEDIIHIPSSRVVVPCSHMNMMYPLCKRHASDSRIGQEGRSIYANKFMVFASASKEP
ncbi:hypothetical protein DPMN_146887 [Dreissena polymorpha]|uniref:Uncharacterized protein n=1 Tax=Dreissena polymorpha TaxID=45954 RepID=A0A9D4F8R8_DREPO|nr:hypothetical protein DPMN_146887 [Dreissena polymorpha]